MADDRDARIAQLETELRRRDDRDAAAQAENRALREQQTATAEVLRAIASSSAGLPKTLDAICEAACQLCHAQSSIITRVEEPSGVLVSQAFAGAAGSIRDAMRREGRSPSRRIPSTLFPAGRAFLERRTIRTNDLAEAVLTEYPESRVSLALLGHRSDVCVPLPRGGQPIGVLSVQRFEVRPFSDREVALLEVFADQAVIAIENARLFQELEQRNREVSETLEQQTATADILRVIASSPTDIALVFDHVLVTSNEGGPHPPTPSAAHSSHRLRRRPYRGRGGERRQFGVAPLSLARERGWG